jgi:hypothetical protein
MKKASRKPTPAPTKTIAGITITTSTHTECLEPCEGVKIYWNRPTGPQLRQVMTAHTAEAPVTESGSGATQFMVNMDEAVADLIPRCVTSWDGVNDEQGNPAELTPENLSRVFAQFPIIYLAIHNKVTEAALALPLGSKATLPSS